MAESDALICLIVTGLLLLVILLPISFSYVDYWEYGLLKRKSTGKVNTSKVYPSGRYLVGPDHQFLKYQADAHLVHLEDVDVFSDGGDDAVGLSFMIDVDLTYSLKQEQIGNLHKDLAKTYTQVVVSRANDAIKNSATTVKFSDYFENRVQLELQFRAAVQDRWDQDPPLHAQLGQFHLGRIHIPEKIVQKQLAAKIQVERNKEEEFLQDARLEREITEVEVNSIGLQKSKAVREAQARAHLITATASAQADQIMNSAINNGTQTLLTSLGIKNEEQSSAYTYIRTLQNRKNLALTVSYLADENVVKTNEQV